MTDGPKRLARYFRTPGALSAPDLAKSIGADRAQVWRWLRGERGPGLELALALQEATKGAVPASSWIRSRRRRGAEAR